MSTLMAHGWPGNVRELENTIERAIVLTTSSTLTSDVVTVDSGIVRTSGVPSLNMRQNVEWIERETIRMALEMSTAKNEAARLMGISPRALSYYLDKHQGGDKSRALM